MYKTWKLDIIHSQTEFAVGTFARLLAFQLDIPLVHTYHTMYEDYVHYVTKGYFDKSSKKIVEYLTRFYCDKTASELIVPTKKTYDLFKEKYKVDKNIHIIPTGIELERFYRENLNSERLKEFRKKYNLKEEDFIALFIGRIAQEKNIVYLIDVVKEVLPECPNLKMLIVGDGPDREEYQKLIEEYGLKEKIIMTGKTPWEDTPYHYHLADIFLTASTTETQGLTVIEAMASEITPICIEDESFANTVIDDLNGKLFKTKVGCKKAIIELYNDKEKNQKLAKQARINVEKYSAKYFAESVLNVYEYALAHKENRLGVFGKLVEKLKSEKDEENETDSKQS